MRPLTGLMVGLSISEEDQNGARGYPEWQVNRTTLQFASAFFSQGTSVLFGHDWREDGVMAAVHGFAQQVEPPGLDSDVTRPRLLNLLPWPDEPNLKEDELVALSSTLEVRRMPAPIDLPNSRFQPSLEMRAIALSQMRGMANDLITARVCVGGRLITYQGFLPGVVEESIGAIAAGKPLFLCGLLGGAASHLINVLLGKIGVRDVNESLAQRGRPPMRFDAVRKRLNDAYSRIADLGVGGLSDLNHLTQQENLELFKATSTEHALFLVLRGLSRLKRASR